MSTDFRSLCAELVNELARWNDDRSIDWDPLLDRARAALAEGEAGPSDKARAGFTKWFCRNYPGPDTIIHRPEWHAPRVFRAAVDALARYGSAPRPIPVSERLPGAGDCDAEGRCWLLLIDPDTGAWCFLLDRPDDVSAWTHWLPAHAIQIPE